MTPLFWSINLFVLSSLICATMVFLYTAKRLEIALATLLGVVLGAVFRIPTDFPPAQVMIWLAWWGVGGFLVTTAGIYRTQTDRSARMSLVQKMAFTPVAALIGNLLVTASAKLTPFTLDRYLYAADGSFGFQAGFACRQPGTDAPRMVTAYHAKESPTLIYRCWRWRFIFLVHRRNPTERFARSSGYCQRWESPGIVFTTSFHCREQKSCSDRKFPFHPPDIASLSLEPIRVEVRLRAIFMPSLHTAWCLAICWCARGLTRTWRMILMAIVALTLLYTLSCHYLVDMVAAIPFTLAVYAVVENRMPWSDPTRRLALCAGAACFAAWLGVLRFGTALLLVSPLVSWTAFALTIALCWRCLYAEPAVTHAPSSTTNENLPLSSALLT